VQKKRSRVSASIRQDEILRATMELVYEKGLRTIRISDVAETLGVSSGLVIYHFRTKDELLATAFRFAAANDLEKAAVIAAEEIDPIKRIISILNWYAPSEQSRSWLLWIDGWSAGRWNPKITEALAEIHESWKQLLRLAIKEAVDNGWSPKYSVDQTATRFTIFTDGLSVAELTGPQEFTKSEAKNWIEEFVSNEFTQKKL
jgi:AcrR family transcriptional regulator